MKFKKNQIVKTKAEFRPLYYKGEKFRIIKLNKNPNLMPIEAVSMRTGECYGFEEDEFI